MINEKKIVQDCIDRITYKQPLLKNIFTKIWQKDGRVLLVGGIVRDAFLGIKESDLDFEVYHLSFEILQNILQEFGPVSFMGKSFGVLRIHGIDADWSIPRKDSSGRKPMVQLDPDMPYEQAFLRRDLTINAMGIDIKEEKLIDPFSGLQDLEKKILKTPDLHFFVQDPLRLFRLMGFVARFAMWPDDELKNICKHMDISEISKERIAQEFKKLFLKSKKPSSGFVFLESIDRFKELFPELSYEKIDFVALDNFAEIKISDDEKISGCWALIIIQLFDQASFKKIDKGRTEDVEKMLHRYVIKKEIIKKSIGLAWYLALLPHLYANDDRLKYQIFAYWLEKIGSIESLINFAKKACLYDEKMLDTIINRAIKWSVWAGSVKPLLKALDLINIFDQKELGKMLQRAYIFQIEKNITDKKELLMALKK